MGSEEGPLDEHYSPKAEQHHESNARCRKTFCIVIFQAKNPGDHEEDKFEIAQTFLLGHEQTGLVSTIIGARRELKQKVVRGRPRLTEWAIVVLPCLDLLLLRKSG